MSDNRKINAMHRLFGKQYGYKCGECSNFYKADYRSKHIQKCEVYGDTHSEATDWAQKYLACGMYNKPYKGRPVIECLRHYPRKVNGEYEQIDGQITFTEEINEKGQRKDS